MDLRKRIEEKSQDFTANERKLAAALLADYPFAGLESIQSFAEKTYTSAPTITRFVQKLGYGGYQEFQRLLIGELKEGQQSPIELRRRTEPIKTGFLNSFLGRTADIIQQVTEVVTEEQFNRICALLADNKRSVYLVGGRISDPIAQLLARHLRQIRRDVYHVPPDPEVWPEYLLRMRAQDVLFMVDFRRYEQRLARLAKMAARKRGSQIVLVTDKWLSPISQHAAEVLPMPIESGTAWDSYCGAIALIEAMISHVAEQDWDATKKRIGDWDGFRSASVKDDQGS
ncbi:MurR/RpiR family transcriptional regulator [Hoeflea poritis]|uniref:MurR/RpiR family transcriptional regulator n=1 Tax=Hoeflea poritis TaxID=2993659 RepID=A0ABT4VSF3_9HYPH|nr:MurR/RpiR family transcriptional regulator [Hoeflea poritis]MDA4847641.1 MurR/RpiR family transcriptional regulator [Hoeflea poritis]